MRKKTPMLIMSFIIIVYLALMPGYLYNNMTKETVLQPAGFSGVISVWHIVGFKPPTGSVSGWLRGRATTIEAKHYGVFFEIAAMDITEYLQRTQRGERADAYSFPVNSLSAAQLRPVNTDHTKKLKPALANSGVYEDKLYAVPFLLCGTPGSNYTDKVQFLGIDKETEEAKLEYIDEFISRCLDPAPQAKLAALGLFSAAKDDGEAEYDEEENSELAKLLEQPKTPNVFTGSLVNTEEIQ